MLHRERAVVIVGAGPSGLFLAGLLARQDRRVLVFEADTAVCAESKASTLQSRSMQLLLSSGVSELRGITRMSKGHFAGVDIDLDLVDVPCAGQWKITQPELTRILFDWAVAQGVEICMGCPVESVRCFDSGVSISVGSGLDVREAGIVIGADGSSSSVRAGSRVKHIGHRGRRRLVRADYRGAHVEARRFVKFGRLVVTASQIDADLTRLMVHDPRWSIDMEVGENVLRGVWEEATGETLPDRPVWMNTFDDSVSVYESLPASRVALIGDAAFDSIPVGGESLNSALLDSYSLSIAMCRGGGSMLPEWSRGRDSAHRRSARRVRYQIRLLLDTDSQSKADQDALANAVRSSRQLERRLASIVSGY